MDRYDWPFLAAFVLIALAAALALRVVRLALRCLSWSSASLVQVSSRFYHQRRYNRIPGIHRQRILR